MLNSLESYFIGLFLTDGSFEENGNKGKIKIELNDKDRDILEYLNKKLPWKSSLTSRTRDTNFKESSSTMSLNICEQKARNYLKELGLTPGKKSNTFELSFDFQEADFFRGIIDGDGSLGFTSAGFPFISLVTNNSNLATRYLKLIKDVTGKVKKVNKNTRDGVYNICVYKEDAIKLCEFLYPNGCFGLNRKVELSKNVIDWKRPASMKKIENRRFWSEEQDQYILSNNLEDSMKTLNRSERSIKMRLFRLAHKGI